MRRWSSWAHGASAPPPSCTPFFFFFTLVTGPRRSLSLKLIDTRVYEPQIRAHLGTTAHFCRMVLMGARRLGPAPLLYAPLATTTEMCSGSEAGSYLRRIDLCITQL